MGISRSRINRNDNLTWPGFVDSLAALLMVVIFVLMIFSVAQFYLNQIVSGQDEALVDLNKEISNLYNLLQIEKKSNNELMLQLDKLNLNFQNISNDFNQVKEKNDALSQLITSLKNSLSESQNKLKLSKNKIIDQGDQLKNKEKQITEIKRENKQAYETLETTITDLEKKLAFSRDELALKIDDILKLEKIKNNLKFEINTLLSNNKEISTEILKERDYTKTLEEKIASLRDKAILSQKENKNSISEIIKLKAQINNASLQMV